MSEIFVIKGNQYYPKNLLITNWRPTEGARKTRRKTTSLPTSLHHINMEPKARKAEKFEDEIFDIKEELNKYRKKFKEIENLLK